MDNYYHYFLDSLPVWCFISNMFPSFLSSSSSSAHHSVQQSSSLEIIRSLLPVTMLPACTPPLDGDLVMNNGETLNCLLGISGRAASVFYMGRNLLKRPAKRFPFEWSGDALAQRAERERPQSNHSPEEGEKNGRIETILLFPIYPFPPWSRLKSPSSLYSPDDDDPFINQRPS